MKRAEYEDALSLSGDNSFQIHTKWPPNSCFVNGYFADRLLAWEAIHDIQPAFNHYKAISYMYTYLSISHSVQEAFKDAFSKNLDNYNQMKFIGHTYTNNREFSVQEFVYHALPGQWFSRNIPENYFRVFLKEEEISELSENFQDIVRRNMLDRYKNCPNSSFANGKYASIDSRCYSEFLRYCYLTQSRKN